ncbi:hypothetical protein [Haliea sp. E17]|uniref:hypothetical protein n=1 Tax=Haliea sp. E17 TaxID=3401576 RepID=UPI003AAC01E2
MENADSWRRRPLVLLALLTTALFAIAGTDPVPDSDYPPTIIELTLESAGDRLPARQYLRTPDNTTTLRIDTGHPSLRGHSMARYAGLAAVAQHSQ